MCHRVGSWLRRRMWARIVPAQEPSIRESRYGSGLDPARAAAFFMLDASNVPPRASVGVVALGIVHKRRLREVYRSAGWPCQDGIEVELLAAGLLQRERGPLGHETIRLTDAGIAASPSRWPGTERGATPTSCWSSACARDDARRPACLARPRGARQGRRRLGDRDARRLLDPPHDGRGVCRADRPRGEGAAVPTSSRPAPARASARPTSTSAASAGT